MLKTIFQICTNVSENAFLGLQKKKKKKKKSSFRKFLLFQCLFSLVDNIIHICIKTWIRMRLIIVFSTKNAFFLFSPQNYAFRNRNFKVSLNRS